MLSSNKKTNRSGKSYKSQADYPLDVEQALGIELEALWAQRDAWSA